MFQRRVVIVGAGFAGAAAAYFLTKSGFEDVVVLENEKIPGAHASGKNAAMARQIVADEHIAELAREGTQYIRNWAAHTRPEHFRQTGSLLVESNTNFLDAAYLIARSADVPASRVNAGQCLARNPLLAGSDAASGIHCYTDGVVDISALLQHYLDGAAERGARIVCDAGVSSIFCEKKAVKRVFCKAGSFPCDVLINAAGAWANEIALLEGAAPLAMTAYQRHLYILGGVPPQSRVLPFTWHESAGIYFRQESGGLLISPCDQTAMPPGGPIADVDASTLLAEKIQRSIPRLQASRILRGWAGLRTIAADERFVIGWDPRVSGLFWIAALGGHGMTCSASIGRLAAEAIAGKGNLPAVFDPARRFAHGVAA